MPLEQVIAAQLHRLFSGMVVEEPAAFRVTRNADLTLEDEEADDLLAAVEMELRRRRFGRAVRLEVEPGMSAEMLELLVRELDLEADDVSFHASLLDLTCLFQLHGLDRPDLKDEPWLPVTAGRIVAADEDERSMFSVIRERACWCTTRTRASPAASRASSPRRPTTRVQSIKMTLYRAGGDSPIARSLIRAAERGVQVAVLVELKARFDEATNIELGQDAGARRRPRRVRPGRAEDPRQVRAGGAQRRRRPAPVLPHRHRQLQLETARLYEDSGSSPATPTSAPTSRSCSTTSPATAAGTSTAALLVAPREHAPPAARPHRARGGFGSDGRIMVKMNTLVDPEHDRGAVPGQPGRACRST